MAAMIGVRLAALIESARIARCTTEIRAQYPNDSTNRSHREAEHSTPIKLFSGAPMPAHACI